MERKGSFLIWKWKFIKVHLTNLESNSKVYYIRRDVPYEKTSTQRLKIKRIFIERFHCVLVEC